ncbi:bis-aminopropyl spermidine synthase family protein [Cryptosporangium arvum]|uniref:Putative methyltransferase n=1 Tax=Cryptosporangium arvum DSM 44712 TaxID=927661 RepID=A0A010ZS99_9ACTN|nr:bis-aminopropyl spermidine synthase family protein [Cryptosporangium arvum]EXG80097.1 putative methyltransferase [Cryptosporangium arvum DSM 44712]
MSADAVAGVISEHGRAVRAVVLALGERGWTLADLVRAFAVPRRTVEEVLSALGDDLAPGGELRIRAERAAEYRRRFDRRTTELADPLGPALATVPDLLAQVTRLRASAPPPRRALDHVAATPETAVRRALWLDAHFDLDGAHLLCVGDHDLTAAATCLLRPSLTATVVDVDERLLAFIDSLGLGIRCVFGDLRFGLPAAAAGRAGLAFTDPPYTPEGIGLFLERAIEGLVPGGRILLAYGFSPRTPALGLAVQRTFGELELAVQAQWPAFSRYDGAQAIGSASDLYLLLPTSKAHRKGRAKPTIYTHGEQSAEASSAAPGEVAAALVSAASGPDRLPVLGAGPTPGALRTAGPTAPELSGERPLGALWTGGVPAPARSGAVAVDASADPGSWLLRVLLAVDARRLAVAVGNNHPDLADAAGQQALAELVAPKWALRFRRSTPGPASAIVEAVAAPDPADRGDRLVRHVLDRAHGRLANVWRDALVTHAGLTKPQAAARVAELLPTPAGIEADGALMEVPRHRLGPLFAAVRASVPNGA